MMTRKLSIAVILVVFLSNLSDAQTNQLYFQSLVSEEGAQCYSINLMSSNEESLLSSQNFRLYYDASVLRFDRLRAQSLLPSQGYQEIKVMQAVHNSNASGFGGLEFGANLGYINMSINEKMDSRNLLIIPRNESLELASICFERMDETRDPTLVWARDPLTSGYSSAFTEIGLYKNGKLELLKDLKFQDIDGSWISHPEKMVDLGTTRSNR